MWCSEEDVHIDRVFEGKKCPKKVRCTKCKKNIRTYIKSCGDYNCFHLYMSKHKVKTKIPKQKTKHERSIGRR